MPWVLPKVITITRADPPKISNSTASLRRSTRCRDALEFKLDVRHGCDAGMPVVYDIHYPWMADNVIENSLLESKDGKISVPDEPGLDIEFKHLRSRTE